MAVVVAKKTEKTTRKHTKAAISTVTRKRKKTVTKKQ